MESKAFSNKEEARQWCIAQSVESKKLAAQNNMWCFTIVSLDMIHKDTLTARNVFADYRGDIERSYTACVEPLKQFEIPYYITNNFDFNKGFEYSDLLDLMEF